MRILITGAAGNLGGFLARHLMKGDHELRLMVLKRPLDYAIDGRRVEVVQADLGAPASLDTICQDVDCIVHFAGVLFKPWPERFLPTTNVQYVENLLGAATQAGTGKFILVSFPHVEGESDPQAPALGNRDGSPASIHAQTRLAAENLVFDAGAKSPMHPIILRPGMIYGRGVLMIEAARKLMRWGLLPVWYKPTWIHLLALPDFLRLVTAAIERQSLEGVINLGDDMPLTLQGFLDRCARYWGYPRPIVTLSALGWHPIRRIHPG
jgi:nucleoside-diphosphate-sugar epimerase